MNNDVLSKMNNTAEVALIDALKIKTVSELSLYLLTLYGKDTELESFSVSVKNDKREK